ncbi:MAG: hypothetical protein HKN18_18490 [Silicimonas sp.]|nr:hypothetical protein [Silicimonas sp.]
MSQEDDKSEPTAPTRKWRGDRRPARMGFGVVMSLTVAGLVFLVLSLALTGRSVPMPEFVRNYVEERVNSRMTGASLSLGAMEFAVGRDGVPQILLSDIGISDVHGGAVVQLNRIGAEISASRLLRGQVAASTLLLAGAQITIRRQTDGSFTLSSNTFSESESANLPDLLARIEQILDRQAFRTLEEVRAGGVVITLEDARSGRIWQATNATAVVRKAEDAISLSVTSDVFNGTDSIAGMQLSLSRSRETGRVSLGVNISDMAAADIALQSPILSWLAVLNAPISGAVRTEIDPDGALASFAGTLDIASGALRPAEDIPPAEFDAAKAYFTFDPAAQRIDFSQIEFAGLDGRVMATGHSYLSEFDGLWPKAFLGQFQVEALDYDGGDVFSGPVSFNDLRADMRLRLDPFTVELAQLVIDNKGTPVHAKGRIEARTGGWHAAIDATTREISSKRVLELWPLKVSPITRTWLSRNLKAGRVLNPAAALRFQTGERPDLSLSFEFEDGVARFLPNMPELTDVRGRAALQDFDFTLAVLSGGVTASSGQRLDASGSVFSVADVRPKPAWGAIRVKARGPLTAALSVLNNRPLRIMERAKRPVDIADADAVATAVVRLPLKDGIKNDEVSYSVTAELRNIQSRNLVEGRSLVSKALSLQADPSGVGLQGAASLDGVPLTVDWWQPFGDAAANGGRITGSIALSNAAVEAFDLPLPNGFVSGQTDADYDLALPVDAPPELALSSDLAGLSMSLPSLGISKPASTKGNLNVDASLGEVPQVRSLELSVPGFSLAGTLDFSDDGFTGADFERMEVGQWLDASVRLTPGERGANIAVTGGTLDLRQLDLNSDAGGDGAGAGAIDLTLDRLIVSDSVSLSPMIGQIQQGRAGLSGDFEGRVNGGTAVSGNLAPANGGTSIRVQSASAAGVIKDAGITPNARGGTLDVVLTPVVGAPGGTYDGQFLIEDIRLRKAPVMADLLDAISVVGLLDQLDGPGIRFDTVDGSFRLTRRRIQLLQAAAVGGSLGISADGIYDFVSKDMDFRGVISPVYFVNAIGSVLTRRGEGLFGFNYRMTGSVDDPRVGVNPLSIFTPGAFRQIFRRSAPGRE